MADEPLLLGLVDENMDENNDRICGWSTNKVGGTPNWMFGAPSRYPTCPLCDKLLYLVCQIYCPLSGSIYHRVLYVFGCVNVPCWNKHESWKVLRSQAKDSNFDHLQTPQDQSPDSRFEVEEWCDDAEDWGDEETQGNAVSSDLELWTGKLKLAENKPAMKSYENVLEVTVPLKNRLLIENSVPRFEPFYINVFEAPKEQGLNGSLTRHEKTLLSDYQQREGIHVVDLMEGGEGVQGWTGEKYEHSSLQHGNKAFYKFNKKLQACPQQCLRYQWNGTPVSMVTLNTWDFSAGVPPCGYCGTQRVFEVQFMPALVGKLKGVEYTRTAPYSDLQQNSEHTVQGTTSREEKSPGSRDCSAGAITESSLGSSDVQVAPGNGPVFSGNPGVPAEHRKAYMAAVTQTSHVAIEFGTVMVFTCAKSCWENRVENVGGEGYLEEFVVVEGDPDSMLFQ